jgi:hypothetical protein
VRYAPGVRAVHAQCRQVLGGRVALVLGKAIGRVLLVQRRQQGIAVHLGHDRRRRDRGHPGIAPDDGFGGHAQQRQPVAVDQHARGH